MLCEGYDLRPRKERLTKDISSSRKPIPVGWRPGSVGSSRCWHGGSAGFLKWFESNSSIQFRYQILNAHTYLKSFFFFCSANQSSFTFWSVSSIVYSYFTFLLSQGQKESQGVISILSNPYFHFEQSPWGQDCSWGILLLGYIRMNNFVRDWDSFGKICVIKHGKTFPPALLQFVIPFWLAQVQICQSLDCIFQAGVMGSGFAEAPGKMSWALHAKATVQRGHFPKVSWLTQS